MEKEVEKDKKTRLVTFRLTEYDYQQYLSIFETAKTKRDKRYTTSDFIRDAIFEKIPPKNMKLIRVKTPSPCKKQRLQMLITTVLSIESIAKSLIICRKNHDFNLKDYLLQIEDIQSILKGELC